MNANIEAAIKKLSPLMDESSEIFRELAAFFGGQAKIEVHSGDLAKFLGRKRLYRIIRIQGESYKDCAYQLIDDYPEALEALGMLRYYKAPAGNIRWEEIEAAEIAMGKELTMNAYGWEPDAWTVFAHDTASDKPASENTASENSDAYSNSDAKASHGLVALLAFDFGD